MQNVMPCLLPGRCMWEAFHGQCLKASSIGRSWLVYALKPEQSLCATFMQISVQYKQGSPILYLFHSSQLFQLIQLFQSSQLFQLFQLFQLIQVVAIQAIIVSILMANRTTFEELARQLTRFRDHGGLKMFMAVFLSIMIIICAPLFVRERRHPMVKHRSWTVNLLACIGATLSILTDGCLSMDNWVKFDKLPVVFYFRAVGVIMAVCAFIPTYVRHYFLLQRPILQTKLLDYETMVDPDKYKALSRRLIRIKFLSSETFALGFLSHQLWGPV
ncbi:hypothetical protein BASA83_000062 [Batrachochytrium salamandrivorans]|nr:hypothetical protein BASA83_000062 [Batrachochytrium salamandrivorans]